LSDLARRVPGAGRSGDDVAVSGITSDSRRVERGDLMVCIPGTQLDGARFAREAKERGAAALVVEKTFSSVDLPQLLVEDARLALALFADHMNGHPSGSLDVVGVTGTDGKTTIVNLGASIAERAGWQPGVIGTFGIRIGDRLDPSPNTTPGSDVLHGSLRRMLDGGARAALIEVSSHGLDMSRTAGVEYRVVILSNLTRDHLDWHGTLERYKEAKKRLFLRASWHLDPTTETTRPRLALLPAGVPAADEFAEATDLPVERYGFDGGAHWRIVDPRLEARGSRARLVGPRGELALELPLPGRFNLLNAAAAAAATSFLGATPDAIRAGLSGTRPISGRMERIDRGQPFAVLVDFAHTPDALRTTLEAVREFTPGRILLVFGAGGDRDRGKRPEMAATAAAHADFLVLTSDNPRSEDPERILDELEAGLRERRVARWREVDRARAVAAAIGEARAGDTVIVAGKGHERFQLIGDQRIPCDDRLLCSNALSALGYMDRITTCTGPSTT
jgi:UDP-N-acetylmuramoyl-L-alanyl-D-glutamate--2,6-diaminopimelate ligase